MAARSFPEFKETGQYSYEYQKVGRFYWRAKIHIVGTCLSATQYYHGSEKRVRNKIAKQIKKMRRRDEYERGPVTTSSGLRGSR